MFYHVSHFKQTIRQIMTCWFHENMKNAGDAEESHRSGGKMLKTSTSTQFRVSRIQSVTQEEGNCRYFSSVTVEKKVNWIGSLRMK